MNIDSINSHIKGLQDNQIIENLKLGKDAFKDHVYELYSEEAQRRNIDLSNLESEVVIAKENNRIDMANKSLDFAKLSFFVLNFSGLVPLLTATQFLGKDKNGNYLYPEEVVERARKYKKIALIFLGIYTVPICLILLFIK